MAWKSKVILLGVAGLIATKKGVPTGIVAAALVLVVLYYWAMKALFRSLAKSKEQREWRQAIDLAKQENESYRQRQLEADQSINEIMESLVDRHIDTLANKRRSLVTLDDYGVEETDRWKNEVAYFINRVILKDYDFAQIYQSGLPMVCNDDTDTFIRRMMAYIDQRARTRQQLWDESINPPRSVSTNIDDLGPLEFEQFCADVMSDYGWQSKTTKGSGDQGVDVVAERDGIKAVLQCKKYTSPIGNKAVQEAHAGKVHYNASIAAVVSNMPFTQSAKELASTTGVHLLHYTDLPEFAERLIL